MPTKTAKRSSLLRFWTLRYVVTLCVGLLIIGVASVLWLQHAALTSRLQNLQIFSLEAADYVAGDTGQIVIPDHFYEWIDQNQRRHQIPGQFGFTVFNQTGSALFYRAAPAKAGARPAPPPPNTGRQAPPSSKVEVPSGGASASDPALPPPPPLADRVVVDQIGDQYRIATPIHGRNSVVGTIAVSYSKKALSDIEQEYRLIASLLLLAGLLGWLILYLSLRKLSKLIYALGQALKRIASGDYRLMLQENVREQEIYDLLAYFNATAARLEQLEQLRTELLAGVTHELKTPITSLRGLLRTVRDRVVTADEADEFLDISLKETLRLEQMVSDLLDFNAFASGKIRIQSEALDLGTLLGEIVYQWSLIHQEDDLAIRTDIPDRTLITLGDAGRIQQIIVNLLNNSWQAISGHGEIAVSLTAPSGTFCEIQVRDNGSGITAAEQTSIFEKFCRGTNKQLAVAGLGLGLTLSRMLANAMDGTLSLKESSSQGTTIQLMLPKSSEQRTE